MTTKDYFKKQPLFIEQSKGNNGMPSDVSSAKTTALTDAIATYEKQYLRLLLGADLAKAYLTAPTAEKWADLNSLLWDEDLKISPIANYIYFFYLSDYSASYNGETFKQAKTEGSNTIQVVQKQVFVWSEMKKIQSRVMEYLSNNYAILETENAAADFSNWSDLVTNYNSAGI